MRVARQSRFHRILEWGTRAPDRRLRDVKKEAPRGALLFLAAA
jgi:hypothetical protein